MRLDQFSCVETVEAKSNNPVITYHPETGRFENIPTDTPEVVGVHGTNLLSVINLMRNGRFSGGHPDMNRAFMLVPNMCYQGWEDQTLKTFVDQNDKPLIYNAHEAALVYANDTSGARVDFHIDDIEQYRTGGAIISFGVSALKKGYEIRSGTHQEMDDVPELELPDAPDVDDIEAIYYVENVARLLIQSKIVNPYYALRQTSVL